MRVLKELGLAPTKVATTPTTDGIIAALRTETLAGKTVGVTLYGVDNPPLVQFLEGAGATVRTVLPYVYAPAADAERVVDLIGRLAAGMVDVLLFTSSPQVDRLFAVAAERGLETTLQQALATTRVAAVGPVLAAHLSERRTRRHLPRTRLRDEEPGPAHQTGAGAELSRPPGAPRTPINLLRNSLISPCYPYGINRAGVRRRRQCPRADWH